MTPFIAAATLGQVSIWNRLILSEDWLRKVGREFVITWAKIKSKAWVLVSTCMLSGVWDSARWRTGPVCKIPLGTSLRGANNLDTRAFGVLFFHSRLFLTSPKKGIEIMEWWPPLIAREISLFWALCQALQASCSPRALGGTEQEITFPKSLVRGEVESQALVSWPS